MLDCLSWRLRRQWRTDVTLSIDDSAGNIGTVDLTTQSVTVIGNAGVVLTDIAFSPSGNLYGNSFTNLYSVSTTTGVATNIGATGVTDLNALVFGSTGHSTQPVLPPIRISTRSTRVPVRRPRWAA